MPSPRIEQALSAVGGRRAAMAVHRATMSPEQARVVDDALDWFEDQAQPGLFTAALTLLGESPLRLATRLLPEVVLEPAQRELAKALIKLSELSARSAQLEAVQEEVSGKVGVDVSARPEDVDICALVAAVDETLRADASFGAMAGGVGGLLGPLALPVEIPLVLGLALRAAHRTCAAFGVDSVRQPGDALPLHALDLAVGGDGASAVLRALDLLAAVQPEAPRGAPADDAPAQPPTVPLPGDGMAALSAATDLTVGRSAALAAARGAASVESLAIVEVRRAIERIALRLAARRLAAVVPFVGAAVGGALGFTLVRNVTTATRHLCILALHGRKQGRSAT